MKKYIFMFFLFSLTAAVFAQSYYIPNWNQPFRTIHQRGQGPLKETISIYPTSFKFEGTIEYKDGYTYLRSNKAVILLILPKKEGLTLDTQEGKGVKAEVWGYLLPTPRYAMIVHVMYIDGGLPIWEPTLLTLIDKFPLY